MGHGKAAEKEPEKTAGTGRLIFIHHQCWEVLPFCRFQRQRCIKIRVLRAQDFYTPLALKTAKGQHLPALVVYKNQSPRNTQKTAEKQSKQLVFQAVRLFFRLFCRCFPVTHPAPFSAVFRLFLMSGIWHFCRWPRRLQP